MHIAATLVKALVRVTKVTRACFMVCTSTRRTEVQEGFLSGFEISSARLVKEVEFEFAD